jgi:hypothetical protein
MDRAVIAPGGHPPARVLSVSESVAQARPREPLPHRARRSPAILRDPIADET